MRPIIEGPASPDEPRRSLRVRLLWFAILWVGGWSATAALAYGLRALLL